MTISKEQFKAQSQPRQETVFIHGLNAEVTIRGYTVRDRGEIMQAAVELDPDGNPVVDHTTDDLLSVCACLVEPKLEPYVDTEWLQQADSDIIGEILAHADRLSRRRQSDYDQMRDFFRRNPFAARFYTTCVERLGEFPENLEHVTEEQFMTYLAASEARDEQQADAEKTAAADLIKSTGNTEE